MRPSVLSRRSFLASSGAFALASVQARASGYHAPSGLTTVERIPFAPGAALIDPQVRTSSNGELRTTIRLRYAYHDVGGYRLYMRTYEGTIPGPTLRARPGDVLKIDIVNDLPPNRDQAPAYPDQPHFLNTTNFHTHGLHVSPSGISDNVFRAMGPGGTYRVEVAIPHDHPAGTFWYHPHNHGGADVQIASGVAGTLIVEGDFQSVPEIVAARERVLVLGEAVFDQFGTIEDFQTLFPEGALRFQTVNGQREPAIGMRPGEVQRWRLVHAGYQDDMNVALEGHELYVIARDGIALPRLTNAGSTLLLAPGQRIDVLVKAGNAGTYKMRTVPYDQGYVPLTGPLARVVVSGEPVAMRLPEALPEPPLRTIAESEITGRRTLTFGTTAPEADATEHWQEYTFTIDGRVFDPNHIDQRVKLGSVEEWTIVNTEKHDHVFHIHVNPFQVTEINGAALREPVWLDTAILPRYGSFTMRSRFLDFTGLYALHCHMMNHEELGMMQIVEVYS
jgi:FtsP/CotA-like multicopper oxidase with cupredoxin domain